MATFVLEISWNGDDDFADVGENVTSYLLAFSCSRGRDYASQLTGRAVAGQLQATLDNRDGRFSSFNASSPLFGNLLPGRKVRLRSTTPTAATLWAGYLDRIETHAGHMPKATLYASGPLIKLAGPNAKVSPAAQANVQTGTLVNAVLDAIDWPVGDRVIDSGDVEVGRWYVENVEALAALQEIEDTEQGCLCEGLAWDIVFEERYNRVINHLTSEATFSDDPAASLNTNYLLDIQQNDPLREIFNTFEAVVQPHELDDLSVLWTLSNEQPVLAAGASRTYVAVVSSLEGRAVAYCESWTTPVVGTDIIQTGVSNGDIAVSVVKTARTMEITVTNNHGSAAATLTLMQARGVPVLTLNPFKVIVSDATSQAAFGHRHYPLPSPWYGNSAFAEGTGQYLIAQYKDPRPILSLPVPSEMTTTLFANVVGRDLSDRITVEAEEMLTKLGINRDFYIESIAHIWSAPGPMETVFELSPAEANPGYWQLDVSDVVGEMVLAY